MAEEKCALTERVEGLVHTAQRAHAADQARITLLVAEGVVQRAALVEAQRAAAMLEATLTRAALVDADKATRSSSTVVALALADDHARSVSSQLSAVLLELGQERAHAARLLSALEDARREAASVHALAAPAASYASLAPLAARELQAVREELAEAQHFKSLYVDKSADLDLMKRALADAQTEVRLAREAVAMAKARPSSTGGRFVRIELAGGERGDEDWRSREPVELKLHMTEERVAQGEVVVERLRAFLRHEASSLASTASVRGGLHHRAGTDQGATSPGGSRLFQQPPMRM